MLNPEKKADSTPCSLSGINLFYLHLLSIAYPDKQYRLPTGQPF